MSTHITLILGGVASGKSARAEALAEANGPTRLYIATAQVHDSEMADKIAAHQARRGDGWRTIEAPLDPGAALNDPRADVVLLDCISMWLTNHLLAGRDPLEMLSGFEAAISACPVPVILVSNEVGLGGVEPNELARSFAVAQGSTNQRLASLADRVELVTAGLPLVLKGN